MMIKPIAGALEDDYAAVDVKNDIETDPKPSSPTAPGAPPVVPSAETKESSEGTSTIGNIIFVQCATGTTSKSSSTTTSPATTPSGSTQGV